MKERNQEEDAVSPVIGVILLVAITVILAAVIGTTVLGFTGQTEPAKKAAVEVAEVREGPGGSQDEVIAYLVTGDNIKNDELYFAFEGVQIQHESGSPGPADRLPWKDLVVNSPPATPGKTIGAGERIAFETENGVGTSVRGREVNVIYDDGETAEIVYKMGPLPGPD